MALPSDQEIKDYLRLSTDVEDELIETLNLTAQAQVQRYLNVPLASASQTFRGRRSRPGPRREPFEQLQIPVYPCRATATITDVDGDTVDASTYTIDPETGVVYAEPFEFFDNGPYTIVATTGWQYHPRFDEEIEPILRQCILDLASDLWSRRNPGAIYEQSGGQVSITYTEATLPMRTKAMLDSLRPKWRAW